MRSLLPTRPPTYAHSLLHHHRFLVSGFGFYKCCELTKRGSRSDHNFIKNRAVDGDSEFEIDPDKARDALRQLDQQLDLISNKQDNPVPKIKASNPYNTRDEVTKEVQDPEAFLPYAFFGLLVFTIFYNILFIKVIKPSVDVPQELAPVRSSIMSQILKDE
ncbi:hypothetical protein M8C21_013615 [Ambrosia artemisiifolia]|uniref:Uncharacterized protein n=1 Tax=Ambrosia artemisiifolia TaxID=4212 RepID=A0AAD5CLD6_AMBAR|nr:hypothetical protein M8C21_013615 [Ambrosia artemisiifolia]